MFLTRTRHPFVCTVTRALTRLCEQLQVFLPDSSEPRQHASVSSTGVILPDELADVRRQIRNLAERRLLVPLNPTELERYEQLCAMEDEALAGTQLIADGETPELRRRWCRL